MNEKIEDRWYRVDERAPSLTQHVWGMCGNRVEVVMLALTPDEYDRYFEFCHSTWYNVEREKTCNVTFWRPIIRPEKIYEIK